MNTLELAKQLKYKEGDQIRGIDEPYPRSIYRVVRIDSEGVHLHWESLTGLTHNMICEKYPNEKIEHHYRLLKWALADKGPQALEWEDAFDFRLATPNEIKKSREEKRENSFNR